MSRSAAIEGLTDQAGEHLRLAEAELAVLKQEWVLAELLSTGEPTAETIAHLAELRRAVERAQQRKDGP
jgi:hypothetical protein